MGEIGAPFPESVDMVGPARIVGVLLTLPRSELPNTYVSISYINWTDQLLRAQSVATTHHLTSCLGRFGGWPWAN